MLTPRPKVQGKVLLLPVDKIVPSAHQARTHFDEQEIARLALSIAQNGLLQPVSVRPGKEKGEYELVAGERRLRACKLAGLAEIPAILAQRDESQSAALGLLETSSARAWTPSSRPGASGRSSPSGAAPRRRRPSAWASPSPP